MPCNELLLCEHLCYDFYIMIHIFSDLLSFNSYLLFIFLILDYFYDVFFIVLSVCGFQQAQNFPFGIIKVYLFYSILS